MDAISLLEADHREIKRLLAEGEGTTERAEKTRAELYATLSREMETHERIEEQILYPALKAHPKARDTVLEGFEEHHVVDEIMGELGQTDVGDETWTAKFTVMKENIGHHIDEEEDEMFPEARRAFSAAELQDLGRRMSELKQLSLQEAPAGG